MGLMDHEVGCHVFGFARQNHTIPVQLWTTQSSEYKVPKNCGVGILWTLKTSFICFNGGLELKYLLD